MMQQHADILDQHEPMLRAFGGALALHVTLIAATGIPSRRIGSATAAMSCVTWSPAITWMSLNA